MRAVTKPMVLNPHARPVPDFLLGRPRLAEAPVTKLGRQVLVDEDDERRSSLGAQALHGSDEGFQQLGVWSSALEDRLPNAENDSSLALVAHVCMRGVGDSLRHLVQHHATFAVHEHLEAGVLLVHDELTLHGRPPLSARVHHLVESFRVTGLPRPSFRQVMYRAAIRQVVSTPRSLPPLMALLHGPSLVPPPRHLVVNDFSVAGRMFPSIAQLDRGRDVDLSWIVGNESSGRERSDVPRRQ